MATGAATIGGMKLGEIIKRERKRQRLSYAQLAIKAGVTPPTIQRLESEQRVGRADTVARVTRALGLDPETVQAFLSESHSSAEELAEEDPRMPLSEALREGYVADRIAEVIRDVMPKVINQEVNRRLHEEEGRRRRIKEQTEKYDMKVMPIPVIDMRVSAGTPSGITTEPVAIDAEIRAQFDNLIGVRVSGDCMEPEILDGDLVIAVRGQEPKDGDIVLAYHGGEPLVKRIKLNGHRQLVPANPKYPPIDIDESTRVDAVVIRLQRNLRFPVRGTYGP